MKVLREVSVDTFSLRALRLSLGPTDELALKQSDDTRPLDTIITALLLRGGATQVILHERESSAVTEIESIGERLRIIPPDTHGDLRFEFLESINRSARLNRTDEENDEIISLNMFLEALALGCLTSWNIVYSFPLPSINGDSSCLPCECRNIVSRLLRCGDVFSMDALEPRAAGRRGLETLAEILRNKDFESYVKGHSRLSSQSFSCVQALDQIGRYRSALVAKWPELLLATRITVLTIPVRHDTFSAMFVSLPEKVGEFFGDTLAPHVDSKRKLVVYLPKPAN